MHTPAFRRVPRSRTLASAAALAALLAGCATATPPPEAPASNPFPPALTTAVAPVSTSQVQQTAKAGNTHESIPDRAVTIEVRRELLLDDGVPAEGIDIATHEGVVTLSGTVDNLLAKDRAVTLAEGIRGVLAVVDDMKVPRGKESDADLARDVRAALARDPATSGYDIDVGVHDGKVSLRGIVHSYAERSLASDVASRIEGVTGVDNHMSIEYQEDRSDRQIQQDIVERLANDVHVDAELIEVRVKNGNVTLTGQVGSAAERALAYADAWVAGATSVDNGGLAVRWWARDQMRKHNAPVRSSAELDQAIDTAFRWDPRVTPGEVTPGVEGGVATLQGVVGSLAAKRAAGDDARNTDGIWLVDNYVQVRPPGKASDKEIQRNLSQRLEHNPYIAGESIRVKARHGRVALRGKVESSFERKQASEEAARTPGVVAVHNELEVARPAHPARPDWQIAEDIETGLRWDPYVEGGKVHVTVRDGVATLTGTVGNQMAYSAAVEEARAAHPRRLVNDLDVVSGPAFLKR